MKLNLLKIFILISPLSLCCFAQQSNQTCDSPEESVIDLNSITKCTIKKDKSSTNNRKATLKISTKKPAVAHYIRKRNKKAEGVSNDKLAQNIDNSVTDIEFKAEKLNNLTVQEVLFSVVDEVPLFPDCKTAKRKEKANCFNQQISEHFAKNFYPERASDDGVTGKVFIQFTVDFQGNVKDLVVKSRKKSPLLEKEIKRVIGKLPNLIPGRHKGLPVNVTYGLPINFSAE